MKNFSSATVTPYSSPFSSYKSTVINRENAFLLPAAKPKFEPEADESYGLSSSLHSAFIHQFEIRQRKVGGVDRNKRGETLESQSRGIDAGSLPVPDFISPSPPISAASSCSRASYLTAQTDFDYPHSERLRTPRGIATKSLPVISEYSDSDDMEEQRITYSVNPLTRRARTITENLAALDSIVFAHEPGMQRLVDGTRNARAQAKAPTKWYDLVGGVMAVTIAMVVGVANMLGASLFVMLLIGFFTALLVKALHDRRFQPQILRIS